MRHLLTIVILPLLAPLLLMAQPNIYMIPDIGAPGMNTQVDIIAPVNDFGKFLLVDGLTPPATLTIRFINPADTSRIRVSPGVVSWNMRMVSFQFFVKPDAATGPVPMQLYAGGTIFDLDTFFIVRPQTFGVKSGGGVIGSGGAGMGQRSRRGAMIVDEMVLRNGNYTFDLSDRDPNRAGNQGYLPVIVLSQGRIVVEPGATISVSAPAGPASKNGGPGGGGGGGYGNDRPPSFPVVTTIPGENDVPLGSGFTGGKSNVTVAPSPGGFGDGTGAGPAALNGAEANSQFKTQATTLRLFGAGPGHPFDSDGRSGGAAVATANTPPNFIGTFYGGGGNGSKGTGLPATADDYNGQVVGNIQIAPLHGGGGGASGGPNDSVGGGGGGAIALHARLDASVATAEARGGNGKNGCDNCGFGSGDASAGGAGGSVIVGGKLGARAATVDLRGGSAGTKAPSAQLGSTSGSGGAGRFRVDGRLGGNVAILPIASRYAGPTTDTLTFVPSRNWTIRGTGRFTPGRGGDSILLFVRGESSDWNFFDPYRTVVRSDSSWEIPITFPFDTLAYLFALQVTPQTELAGATPSTRIPSHIFSQSAANIVRVQLRPPVLDAPAARMLDTVRCSEIRFDTFTVRNTGTGSLVVAAGSGFIGPNRNLYRIVSPALPDTIAQGSTRQWVVSFDPDPASNGPAGTMLRLLTNDAARTQWDIAYTVERSVPNPLFLPSSIAFGDVQVGTAARRTIVVTNPAGAGSAAQTTSGFFFSSPDPRVRVIWPQIPPERSLLPGDTMHVVIEFAPNTAQAISSPAFCLSRSIPCKESICIPLSGRGVRADILASRDPLLLVDSNCTTVTAAEDTITLINTGSQPLTVSGLTATPNDLFTIISPAPGFPIPPGGSREVRVRYRSGKIGDTTGTLAVTSNDPQRPGFTIELIGRRDTVIVSPSLRALQFRSMLSCESSIDTSFELVNLGTDTVRINPVNITPPFIILNPPVYVLPPGGRQRVNVRFAPLGNGTFSSLITYRVSPCDLLDTIQVSGERVATSYTISDVAFSDVTVGASGTASSTILNGNNVGIRIAAARFVPALPELTVNPGQFPIVIPPGSQGNVSFRFTPTTAGDIPAGIRIEVDIDSICVEKLGAAVTGRGIPGGVALNKSSLQFGQLLTCQTLDDTVTITNVGQIPVTISAPTFIPPASGAFFPVVGGTFAPGALAPGASATIIIRFRPTGADGPRSGILRFATDDPLRPQVDIQLDGELVSAGAALTGAGLAPTASGTSSSAIYWVVNTGSAPLTIDRAIIPPPFRIISTNPALSATLLPGDSIAIEIEFAPQRPGDYSTLLRLSVRTACDSVMFTIVATSLDRSVIAATVTWENSSGAPGDLIRIPLRLDNDLTQASVTALTVGATFNRTMLVPLRIILDGTLANGWTIRQQRFSPGHIEFTAEGTSPLAGTGTLAYLEALVTLGDSLTTTIGSPGGDSATANSPRASLEIVPGLFTLQGYCMVGGNRLIAIEGLSGLKSIRPNPAAGDVTIELGTIEQGRTRLRLIDPAGRTVATLLDEELPAKSYIVTLPTEDLPAGVYYLELLTPTGLERKGVVVVK